MIHPTDPSLLGEEKTNKVELAIEALSPITYEPHYIAYFVLKDGCDLGGDDYCINCIDEAVNLASDKSGSFTYEGHDPDFSGGCSEPNRCANCGEPFQTEFTPDLEEAKHLLFAAKSRVISDQRKWEIEIALTHYKYCKPDVQLILDKVIDKILNKKKKQPTGILKELMELKRHSAEMDGCECCGQWVSTKEDNDGDLILWSDLEKIINKYLNP